jgi:hypothetical protein
LRLTQLLLQLLLLTMLLMLLLHKFQPAYNCESCYIKIISMTTHSKC